MSEAVLLQDRFPEALESPHSAISLKAVNEESREALHMISTRSRDRGGDIVEPKGVDLRNYRKNPIVVANHDYSVGSIIGKSMTIDAGDDGLWTRTKFLDTPLAETAFQLTKARLGGWSIGFIPRKRHSIKQGKDDKCPVCSELFEALAEGKDPGDFVEAWGQHHKEWELLEYSSVAIPMNQDVVNNAVQRGLCPEALVPRFFVTEQTTAESVPPADAAADGPKADPEIERLCALADERIDRILAGGRIEQRARRIMREL